jgi:hypothetical protein
MAPAFDELEGELDLAHPTRLTYFVPIKPDEIGVLGCKISQKYFTWLKQSCQGVSETIEKRTHRSSGASEHVHLIEHTGG